MGNWKVVYKSEADVEADDLVFAKEAFRTAHPSNKDQPVAFYDEETGDKHEVIGVCEICVLPIIDGEEYQADEDGLMMHQECIDEDASGDGTQYDTEHAM